jgi:hypothetical protein
MKYTYAKYVSQLKLTKLTYTNQTIKFYTFYTG